MQLLVRADADYDRWVSRCSARTSRERWGVVGLHLLPGVAAGLIIRSLVPAVHDATGIGHHWLQLVVLGAMALGWQLLMPFVWLRRDGLTFRESLACLGFTVGDPMGLLIVAPILVIATTVCGAAYLMYGYEPVRLWLDAQPLLHMPEWHILYYGYFNFPAVALAVVLVGNFAGEEVYFRGYLLKRLGFLGAYAWLANNALFLLYHFWQAPVNWAYLPIFFLMPFGPAMAWRRSIWVPMLLHVALNLGVMEWLLSLPEV